MGLIVAGVIAVASIVLVSGEDPDLRGLPPFTASAPATGSPEGTGPGDTTPPSEGGSTSPPPEGSSSSGPAGPVVLPPGEEPVGLGDDPDFDRLANQCFDGDMDACDELYFGSPIDSDYEEYGDTCGGRVGIDEFSLCVFYEDSLR